LNPEKRLELLEAFASSKPAEFDGFTAAWLEQHPEPAAEEPTVVTALVEPIPVEEEKPKRKRKTTEESSQ
jgi:hypothetical protein